MAMEPVEILPAVSNKEPKVGDMVLVEEKRNPWINGAWLGEVKSGSLSTGFHIKVAYPDKVSWAITNVCPDYHQNRGLYVTSEDKVMVVAKIVAKKVEF